MKRDNVILALTVIGTSASVLGMLFTATIALKCNGKIVRSIERTLGVKISD